MKVKEVLDAIKTVVDFIEVSNKINEILEKFSVLGIDLENINPYDFSSLMKLASIQSTELDLTKEDIEEIEKELNEFLEMDLDKVRESLTKIQRYIGTYSSFKLKAKSFSRVASSSNKDINSLAQMFGLKLPKSKRGDEEDFELSEVEEFNEEEIKKVVEEFKKSKK